MNSDYEKKEVIETLSRLTNEGQIRSHNLRGIINSIYNPKKHGSKTDLLDEIEEKITLKDKKWSLNILNILMKIKPYKNQTKI